MIGKIILYALFFTLLGTLGWLSYNLYLDFYSSPLIFKVNYTALQEKPSYPAELQFYSDMRFSHVQLSYRIGQECPEKKRDDIISAFIYLENRTMLRFYEIIGNADIEVKCSEERREEESEYYTAGEGGPTNIINTSLFSVIENGRILLLYKESCNSMPYNIALHELLHVLGFKHSNNKNSIMYNISSCQQVLTNDIVSEINRLYSIQALPDLYFSNINAIKRGSYVNVNFSVMNQGLVDAENVKVILYGGEENKEEESFNLNTIEFGAGKIINAENIKVSLNTRLIKLIIQDGEELNEENNGALLTLF